MTNDKRIFLLEEAQTEINSAIEKINKAMTGTRNERSIKAYILAHLENWANGEHTYDDTIPKLIEDVRENEEE